LSEDKLIDWKENKWFLKYHFDSLTDEFKLWWKDYYGTPEEYEQKCDDGERREYWFRCAFALKGWNANKAFNEWKRKEI
jgi:hypothetical protein